jgi:hypothetical protein
LGAALVAGPLGAASASAQWQTIVPGGETLCSDGSPYRFFVHPGNSARLLIEFEGGGACWSGATCEQDIYNRRVLSDPEAARVAGQLQGIYDRTNPQNPVADFTHVYVPYCSGDLHWGHRSALYTGATGRQFGVEHRGGVNAGAAVDFATASFPAASEVVVAGCSAGGYGAALWSASIARRYPTARVTQFADSAAGVVPDGFFATLLEAWGSSAAWPSFIPALSLDRNDPARLSLPSLYTGIASFFPGARFAQFNTQNDTVQTFFFVLAKGAIGPNDGADWSARMAANVALTAAQNPTFRSFVMPGTEHCVINKPSLYTAAAPSASGPRRVVDWLRDLVTGAEPGNVP